MPLSPYNAPVFRRGRGLNIAQATLEYLVSLLCTGSFLATLTGHLGISDGVTGILSSVGSLCHSVQLLSLFFRPKNAKPFVVVFSLINQLLFTSLYITPLWPVSTEAKAVIFIITMLSAQFTYNLALPKKVTWLMSLVEDDHRGRFTANKEIISLLSGMVFSFLAGLVIDFFRERGEIETALTLSAVVLLALTVAQILTLVFTVEPAIPGNSGKRILPSLKAALADKTLHKIIVIFVLYYVASYSTLSFFGTFQIKELGLSLTYISAITIIGSLARIAVSRFWGSYADKKGFARMLEKCYAINALALLCAAFSTPRTGAVTMALYIIIHAISMGGINSALTNMVFEYSEPSRRADSLAVCQAASGLSGFLSTVILSPLLTLIQSGGNRIFGITVYGQQLFSVFGVLLMSLAIILLKKTMIKK